MPADSIRARGLATAPQCDAGYMTATSSFSRTAIFSCTAGRTIYGLTACRMRSAYCLRGFGTIAPRLSGNTPAPYAYRGPTGFAPLSMAGSGRIAGLSGLPQQGRRLREDVVPFGEVARRQADQVTAAQIAVDGEVEQGDATGIASHLQPGPDDPDPIDRQGWLRSYEPPPCSRGHEGRSSGWRCRPWSVSTLLARRQKLGARPAGGVRPTADAQPFGLGGRSVPSAATHPDAFI
jgi:hypothetical protein